jgi:hypothetical protein
MAESRGMGKDLELTVRDLCQQIDRLAEQIPDEADRAYAEVAKKCLWKMYQRAFEHADAHEEQRGINEKVGDD